MLEIQETPSQAQPMLDTRSSVEVLAQAKMSGFRMPRGLGHHPLGKSPFDQSVLTQTLEYSTMLAEYRYNWQKLAALCLKRQLLHQGLSLLFVVSSPCACSSQQRAALELSRLTERISRDGDQEGCPERTFEQHSTPWLSDEGP